MKIQKIQEVMKENLVRAGAAILASVCLVLLSGCAGSAHEQKKADTINVVTSIGQWSSLAKQLGGEKVETKTVIANPNADAHDYEPTTSDIAMIAKADVVVVNGAGYDTWASKSAKDNGNRTINVAQSSNHKSGDNPHLWFSHDVRVKAAQAITESYKELRPADADYFTEQYKAWDEREQKLDKQIRQIGKQVKETPYAATESVAYYLGEDMQLNDVTPKGFSRAVANESEPSPVDIHEFEQLLTSKQAKLLVFNEQESTAVSNQLETLAKQSSIPVVKVSEQMPQKQTDLLDWINELVLFFSQALNVTAVSE